ncbi:adhesion G protein-coupled receptor F5 [Anolis carolinensis]|uniref:adhesion G protein-coupled receptor F5 n=1 Tax=Anolis carolinensis TaxID=28377 RepID=UPI002F2B268B
MLFWQITIFWSLTMARKSLQSSLDFRFGSLSHSSIHSKVSREQNREEFYKQKRQAVALDSSTEEQTFVIEINFADSSLQETLRSYLNNLNFPLLVNLSDSALKITSINVTTVCNSTVTDTSLCYCEHGYGWPSNTCKAYPSCPETAKAAGNKSCKCLALLPSQGGYCQPQSANDPSILITKMSLQLDEPFHNDLWDSSSVLFKRYKYDLETALTTAYRSLRGFITVTVTGFRPGSIVVEYEITSTGDMLAERANAKVAEAIGNSYKLKSNSFAKEILGNVNFSVSPEDIFEGDTVRIICESSTVSSNVTWSLSGRLLSSSRHSVLNEFKGGKSTSTLTITSIKLNESGNYSCSFMEWNKNLSLIYKAVENIIVSSIKIAQSDNISIVCNGEKRELSCCTDRDIQEFYFYWKPNGSINISGSATSTHNCTTYVLQANESQCPADKSGSKTDYTCELNTTYGARNSRVISVTYFRAANVIMSSNPIGKVSKGHPVSVTCLSDVSNYDQVTWQIQTGSSLKEVDSVWFTTKKTPRGAESVLNIVSANEDWAGTYICTFYQSFLNSSAHMKIKVFPLPLKQEITRDPIETFVSCPVNQVLKCCISKQENYTVTFSGQKGSPVFSAEVRKEGSLYCYYAKLVATNVSCRALGRAFELFCEFTNQIGGSVKSSPITLKLVPAKKVACNSSDIGTGESDALVTKPCLQSQGEESNLVRGHITYRCSHTKWIVARNDCLTVPLNNLLTSAESLVSSPESVKNLPTYLAHLNTTVKKEQKNLNTSVTNLKAVVEILSLVSAIPVNAEQTTMKNFLSTVDTIMSAPTGTWNDFKNGSSQLLDSVEQFSRSLQPVNNTIPPVRYGNIQLEGAVVDPGEEYNKSFTFSEPSRLSGGVLINETKLKNETSAFTIISVAYSTLDHIIAQSNKTDGPVVNGLVLSTVVSDNNKLKEDFQIDMVFTKREKTLRNPQCVFWNFNFTADGGGWDSTGCESREDGDNIICTCNHLTSFSVLMSPSHEDPCSDALTYLTYIGLGISILSLMACIGIELVVWKSVTKTRISYMRHVCILNIAISLLIADIWFLVVAIMDSRNEKLGRPICIAATFFTHYFYLCVFFWMLTLGLMLFYHLVFILHNASKTLMKTVGFCLGYLCPLAISVITIASTISSETYTKKDICLLNWEESKALLALVIPAMVIVAINAIVTIVVIAKIPRRSIGEKSISEEKKSLYRIAKSIGVLTPLLGLTWGFGLATVVPGSPCIFHILFTIFNAFQGLFIFLCGTLWDRKVREVLLNKASLSRWSSQQTKSTSQGMSAPMLSISSPFSKTLNNLFGKAGKYQVSSTESTSSSSENTSKAYSLLT